MALIIVMKKILLSFLFMNLFVSLISAQEIDEDGTYQIFLSYDNKPSYSLLLPTSVDVSENNSSFDFSLKGQIYYDQSLCIDFDSVVEITNGFENKDVFVSQEKNTWDYEEMPDEFVDYTVTLNHDDLKAGTYKGSLNVLITLKGAN